MRIKVRVYAFLRKKLGWDEKVIELDDDDARLGDVISSIPMLNEVITSDDDLKDYMVLVNGLNALMLSGLSTKIKDGDEIDIFPPAAGG